MQSEYMTDGNSTVAVRSDECEWVGRMIFSFVRDRSVLHGAVKDHRCNRRARTAAVRGEETERGGKSRET